MRTRHTHVDGALSVLAVLGVLGVGTACQAQNQVSQPPAQAPTSSQAAPPSSYSPALAAKVKVAFLGDYYLGKLEREGDVPQVWSLLAKRLGCRGLPFMMGVDGYVSSGDTPSFQDRVPMIVAAKPDIVVVAGGHFDIPLGDEVRAAADKVLGDLRQGVEGVDLIVLGPMWHSGNAPFAMNEIDAELRQVAEEYGATFVDPIKDGWFVDARAKGLLVVNEVDLTDAGRDHVADLLEPVLRPLVAARAQGRGGR